MALVRNKLPHCDDLRSALYMFLASILQHALQLLVPLSIVFSSYLYLYPVFHWCAFPAAGQDEVVAYSNTIRQHFPIDPIGPLNTSELAPFRLLALGDPQLEGDSSIPDPTALSFPHFFKFWDDALLLNGVEHSTLQRIRYSLHDLVDFYFEDIPTTFEAYRKRLDLFGNDLYLAHIYRTLRWWTKPTHVSVLGDLLGSQWVDDDEFTRRSGRFWNHAFHPGQRLSDELTAPRDDGDITASILGEDAAGWSRRILNIAGNHDIGYAGDLTSERLERFEKAFGRANYELRFQLPLNASQSVSDVPPESGAPTHSTPELRIVVLNSMNLDGPVLSETIQDRTYDFVNKIITTSYPVERNGLFTLLLTHIPLHKEEGICVDAPFFDYHTGGGGDGVKEQNHLSPDASNGILEGIFGLSGNPSADGAGIGRRGLIMTGHDHEGCDVYHYINQSEADEERHWQAMRYLNATTANLTTQTGVPGLREITIRSMMGDYSGNAGLLSVWFDKETWEWRHAFATCELGKTWIWWAVHVLDLVTLVVVVANWMLSGLRLFGVEVEVGWPEKTGLTAVVRGEGEVNEVKKENKEDKGREKKTEDRVGGDEPFSSGS